jgi:FixJ family two-component response regulator
MASSTTSTSPVVFIVDDDISVRESLELLVAQEGWRPRLFASATEFLARPPERVAGCLVLDIGLPDLNGLELQERIADRADLPIIFITGHGDIPMTVKAMKAGAVEFLTKPFGPDELLSAIHGAIERSRSLLTQEADLQALREHYESLTARERDVMALVVRGLMNKQVAGELGITEITVKVHRGRVMQKMEANSFAELVSMAARLGQSVAGKD